MRWDNLFDDLESQLEHELSAEDIDLKAEEERLRLGRLSLRDRLVSMHAGGAAELRVHLRGGMALRLHPLAFGKDWISANVIEEGRWRGQVVLPLAAVGSIVLDHDQVESSLITPPAEHPRGLTARLGLTFVLRDLCRRRTALELLLSVGAIVGESGQVTAVHGTIDRVGRDHCDVAVHEAGSPRRESAVTQYRIVPIDQVLLVRL